MCACAGRGIYCKELGETEMSSVSRQNGFLVQSEDWEMDSMHWHGKVLTGTRAHWCDDYDGLPVDDTCCEALNCTCFHGTPEQRTEEERESIQAMFPGFGQSSIEEFGLGS